MTRRAWLAALRRRGVRLSLEGERDYLRVRGRLTRRDRERLQIERAAIVRLLKRRRARQEQQQPAQRQIVGQCVQVNPGRPTVLTPIYADDLIDDYWFDSYQVAAREGRVRRTVMNE